MLLSKIQTQQLLSIINKFHAVFIAKTIGPNFLTPQDKIILQAAGINLSNFTKNGLIQQSFQFGVLAEALGNKRAAKMNYKQFLNFIESGKFVPLTDTEEFALNHVKQRAYNDISGLGNRITSNVNNTIIQASARKRIQIEKLIKDKVQLAVENRESAQWLASELGHATGDWARDFDRIADYLLHEAYDTGRAQSILRTYGNDAKVFKDVYAGACKHCKSLYLTDPDDMESKPIIYKLTDLIANGNNIGVVTANLKPVVGPTHPYCRCTLNHFRPEFDWNPATRNFDKPKDFKPTNPRLIAALKKTPLDIKVKVG